MTRLFQQYFFNECAHIWDFSSHDVCNVCVLTVTQAETSDVCIIKQQITLNNTMTKSRSSSGRLKNSKKLCQSNKRKEGSSFHSSCNVSFSFHNTNTAHDDFDLQISERRSYANWNSPAFAIITIVWSVNKVSVPEQTVNMSKHPRLSRLLYGLMSTCAAVF